MPICHLSHGCRPFPARYSHPAMATKRRPSTEIGWREWVSLPELGVEAIQAKVDTGADSSSLHAFNQERFQRDGVEWIRFEIHPKKRARKPVIECEAPVVMERKVRNPGGRSELRPVISTAVVVNGVQIRALINLTERDEMTFRMLIGRRTMRGKFVVNPGRSYLGAKPEPKKQSKPKRAKKKTASTDNRKRDQ
mgnify:CR=1 FL=1